MEEFVSRLPRAKVGKHEQKRRKRKMAVRGYGRTGEDSRSKNNRLKEFKYTLEIKATCTQTREPESFPLPRSLADFFLMACD